MKKLFIFVATVLQISLLFAADNQLTYSPNKGTDYSVYFKEGDNNRIQLKMSDTFGMETKASVELNDGKLVFTCPNNYYVPDISWLTPSKPSEGNGVKYVGIQEGTVGKIYHMVIKNNKGDFERSFYTTWFSTDDPDVTFFHHKKDGKYRITEAVCVSLENTNVFSGTARA